MSEVIPTSVQHFSMPEKNLVVLDSLIDGGNLNTYSDLLMWVMENAQQLGLSMVTKYHARVYFDRVLSQTPGISQNRYMLLFIACLSVAIKFNESREVSERLTMHALMSAAGIDMTSDDYFQFEVFILQSLNFKLRYTTPQDHLTTFLVSFSYQSKLFQQALPSLILLALIHPRACEFNAEEIFFGAVLSVLQMVPLNLDSAQSRSLFNLSQCWERAALVKELIEEQTQLAEGDDEEPEEE